MAMPQVHIVSFCADLGYGPAVGAEMLSLMLATGIISRLASGFIADRIGGVRTVILGSVLQTIALALYIPYRQVVEIQIGSSQRTTTGGRSTSGATRNSSLTSR